MMILLKMNSKKLEPVDLEFKNTWLKIRKYEYYQNHKRSVDKYGKVEPCMLLTNKEVMELKAYLVQKGKQRKEQIEQYKLETNAPQRIIKRKYYN